MEEVVLDDSGGDGGEKTERNSIGRRSLVSFKQAVGKLIPTPSIVFFSQMLVIYIVIGVSLFNLTRGDGDDHEGKLWIALLSSCLGYILPNPTFKQK